jgi:hypothetical protein
MLDPFRDSLLGAARSGTTAVAHALFETLEYAGNEEGHIFDLLASFAVSLRRFWELKSDDWSSNRNTTIRRVSVEYMEQALNSIFVELGRSLFGVRPWLDKTPTSDMIHLAPRFLHIWPKDNILSRQRKFDYDFERNCREWANAMSAWAATRDKLQGSFIELDQAEMASRPSDAARSISYLLALGEVDTRRLARRLSVDHPQRTGGLANIATSLTATSWTADQVSSFRRIAGPMMAFYGYQEE